MRRICLFAGYDKNNKIQDYVVYLLQQLAKISDVYYMGNGEFSATELAKIAPYTKMFYAKTHKMQDFGSWQFLISRLGWDKIAQYDEMILCNDSVYGPLCDLENVFWKMERKGYNFWSITSDYQYNFHLQRYFMVFNNEILVNEKFHNFWKTINFYYDVRNCEFELTPILTDMGFVGNSYIRNFERRNVLQMPEKLLDEYDVPFVKVKNFLPENVYTAGT